MLKNISLALCFGVVASAAVADNVILDDNVVEGSICAGNDCVNGETFGFDTIRLKENNVRIKFQDTSNSVSFPKNDWTLVANDSSNGGLNYFGIEDSDSGRMPFRVLAGAPADALRVASDGSIGFGIESPLQNIHIFDTNKPTIRLEQDPSGGFAASTWDIGANELGLTIELDNTPKFAVLPNGDVKITGDLTGSVAEADFPDYVFAEDYSLMPLSELKQYVDEQKHLPEIPSAREVAENGLNISQLQIKLLKKVEELTLYTVQQQQQIESLKEQLKSIQQMPAQ